MSWNASHRRGARARYAAAGHMPRTSDSQRAAGRHADPAPRLNCTPSQADGRSREPVHQVEIVPGTTLAAIAGGSHHWDVNSRHHQAIDKLGEGLRISARDPEDGTIEAVELPGQTLRRRRAVASGKHERHRPASGPPVPGLRRRNPDVGNPKDSAALSALVGVYRRPNCLFHHLAGRSEHQLQGKLNLPRGRGSIRLSQRAQGLPKRTGRSQRIAGGTGLCELDPIKQVVNLGAELRSLSGPSIRVFFCSVTSVS